MQGLLPGYMGRRRQEEDQEASRGTLSRQEGWGTMRQGRGCRVQVQISPAAAAQRLLPLEDVLVVG